MDATIRQQYLAAQVCTAPPERLHLLLLDGAARFAGQLRHALGAGDLETASIAGVRLRDILTEMITTIRRDDDELTRRMRAIYFYLIRALGEAQMALDAEKVSKIIDVLEVERQTWRMVCDRLAESTNGQAAVESMSLQA